MTDDSADETDTDQAPNFVAEIEVLRVLVAQGRELVAQGNTIDLEDFQEQVSGVCAEVAKNPPANVDEVMKAMERLSDDLTNLAEDLRRQAEAIGGSSI